MTFIGDGNNVANSLILCGALLGVEVRIACPKGYEPSEEIMKKAYSINNKNLTKIFHDPYLAVSGANVLYTDVWSSMGEEENKEKKDLDFEGFSISKELLNNAKKESIVLHCLPAYRGKEIDDEVIDSMNSRIFDQAENRMHVQQALLYALLS